MVIFNADVNLFERSWALENKTIGQIHVGTITEASIGYTLKYISKASKIPLHKNDDRQKEFSLMSKGLGSNYLTKNMVQWHKNNPEERVYVPLLDGKKAPLPRYYKEKIFDEYEKEKIAFHFQKKASLSQELLVKEHGNNLPSFLAEQYLNGLRKMNATDNTQKL